MNDPTLAVQADDVHALMECCHNVEERELDLIIHSPGGSPDAAEQVVNYLRTQFDYIRCFVPLQAKSAATMIALGCDEIVLGLHSELGPIDPQILVFVPEGQRFAPAHAVLRDFERAKEEIGTDVSVLPTWTPILRGYTGGLIDFCTQQIQLSQEIVAGWLEQYMLTYPDVKVEDRAAKAEEISSYFGSEASYNRFRTHGRPIRVERLEQEVPELRVRRLEADDALQDAVLSIYHALDITFGGPTLKIVENHLGRRKVSAAQQLVIQAAPTQSGA
ncbi:MAG: serine protease [Actinomycetota bacterium]|nr:serine protease [Actinomycetota bacterium]